MSLALAHLLTNALIATGMNSTTMSLQEFAQTRLVGWDGSDDTFPDYIFDAISSAEASKLLSMGGENSRKLTLMPNITNIDGLAVDGAGSSTGVKGAGGLAGRAATTGFERGTIQFSLGAALSGTPLHWHNDAVNHLVRGRKLWTLQPPVTALPLSLALLSPLTLCVCVGCTQSHATYSRVHAQLEVAMPIVDGEAFRCVQVRHNEVPKEVPLALTHY